MLLKEALLNLSAGCFFVTALAIILFFTITSLLFLVDDIKERDFVHAFICAVLFILGISSFTFLILRYVVGG